PPYAVAQNGPGIVLDTWPRRLVLAWALQAGQLLTALPQGARLVWHLSPDERFGALLPFAEWGQPVPVVVDNELGCVSDGYVTSDTFRLTCRLPWRRALVTLVKAAFVGVVWALTGPTAIYLRGDAETEGLSRTWASIAGGVVLPIRDLPPGLAAALPYPEELFALQARALGREPLDARTLGDRPETGPGEPGPPTKGWRPDTGGTRLVALYERPSGSRVSAALAGATRDGRPVLDLVRLDSAKSLPAPRGLDATWRRFPSFL